MSGDRNCLACSHTRWRKREGNVVTGCRQNRKSSRHIRERVIHRGGAGTSNGVSPHEAGCRCCSCASWVCREHAYGIAVNEPARCPAQRGIGRIECLRSVICGNRYDRLSDRQNSRHERNDIVRGAESQASDRVCSHRAGRCGRSCAAQSARE